MPASHTAESAEDKEQNRPEINRVPLPFLLVITVGGLPRSLSAAYPVTGGDCLRLPLLGRTPLTSYS